MGHNVEIHNYYDWPVINKTLKSQAGYLAKMRQDRTVLSGLWRTENSGQSAVGYRTRIAGRGEET